MEGWFSDFFKYAPEIIARAAENPLGIAALVAMIIGIVVVVLFHKERSGPIRLLALILTIVGLVYLLRSIQISKYEVVDSKRIEPTTHTVADISGRDGNGNNVDQLSSIQFTINGKGPKSYLFSYGFYNGSGTWRGDQKLSVKILGKDNAVLDVITFQLDRSKCVYGGAEPRSHSGVLAVDPPLISGISVVVSAVTGTQTGC